MRSCAFDESSLSIERVRLPISFSTQAVQQFYYEPSSQQEVHRWLTAGQMSQEAWSFSWQLLKPEKVRRIPTICSDWLSRNQVFIHLWEGELD